MLSAEHLQAISKFQRSMSLCDFFQLLAVETWERIKFSRTRRGMRIFETTITQNILFELIRTKEVVNRLSRSMQWNLQVLESENEKTNGNDIELFVPFGSGYLYFPTQAKIIYHQGFKRRQHMSDGNYPPMDHYVPSTEMQQIDALISYASSGGGVPIYLLYNYVNDSFAQATRCQIPYGIQQFGCSIIDANYLRNHYFSADSWTIPTFKDLHPLHALPWFVLVCCVARYSDISKLMSDFFPNSQSLLKTGPRIYSTNEVFRTRGWRDIDFAGKPSTNSEAAEGADDNLKFAPRFRIILDPETPVLKK